VPGPGDAASPTTGSAADDREIQLCLVAGDAERPVVLGSYPASELEGAGITIEPPLVECAAGVADDAVAATAVTQRISGDGRALPSALGSVAAALLAGLCLTALVAAHRRARHQRRS
jgi:hypothetical protein